MKKALIGVLLGVTVFATACGSSATTAETTASVAESTTVAESSTVASETLEAEESLMQTAEAPETETAETETTEAEATSTSGIASFEDVDTDAVSLIALGNSDVPVGQYAQEIFENLGIWDSIQSKISYGTNVKEVLAQVEEGSVDCGVVYATDAATSDGVNVVATAADDLMDTKVIYPAAMVKDSENEEAANAFLNFLLTDDAVAEFEKVGFTMADTDTPEDVTTDAQCTLNVFAAASLTEALNAIEPLFEAEYPGIDIVYNLDSSGTLETQIENGAEADVFLSASQKQMNALDEAGDVAEDTRIDILKNSVVLIVPKN